MAIWASPPPSSVDGPVASPPPPNCRRSRPSRIREGSCLVNARLQAHARANPATAITGALRALCLGGPTARLAPAVASYRHAAST